MGVADETARGAGARSRQPGGLGSVCGVMMMSTAAGRSRWFHRPPDQRIRGEVAPPPPPPTTGVPWPLSHNMHGNYNTMRSVVAPQTARPARCTGRGCPRPARALLDAGGPGSNGAGRSHHTQQQQQQQPSIQHPLFPEAEREAAEGQWRVPTQRGLPLFKTTIPDRPCPVCGGTGKTTCGDCRWAAQRGGVRQGRRQAWPACMCAAGSRGTDAGGLGKRSSCTAPSLQGQGQAQLPGCVHAAAGRVAPVVSSTVQCPGDSQEKAPSAGLQGCTWQLVQHAATQGMECLHSSCTHPGHL